MDTCSMLRGALAAAKELTNIGYLGSGIIYKQTDVAEIAGVAVADVFIATFTVYAVATLIQKIGVAVSFAIPRLRLVASWLRAKTRKIWRLLKQL